MAEAVNSVVDRNIVSKQITDTTSELIALNQALNDNLQSALQLNQALGQSQSLRQLRTNVEQAAIAQERLTQAQLRTEQAQQRLIQLEQRTAQQRAQTQAAEERTERQRQTNEANDQRRAAASNQRATQATQRAREQSRPYQLLTLALREAEAAASDLGTVFGANSPQFQQAAARVQELRTQVDSIEQPLGRFQRNVGNYASGVTGALQTGFGYLRTAANIIPGLGLSGIFLLGFEGLKSLTQQLGFFKESTSSAREVLKSLNEVNKNASDEYGKQSTNLRILYQAATDVTNSTEARLRAARELQKEFPTTFKNITTEAILNGDAKASYDKLTNSILDNAKARAAADKIADLAGKQQEIDFQKQKIRNAEESEIARQRRNRTGTIQLNNPNIDAVAASPAVLEAAQEKIIRDRASNAVKLQDQNRKILQDQIDFLTKYAGGNNKIADALSQDGGNTPKIKAPKDTSIQDQLAAIDRLIKRATDANDAIQKSEDASYEDRIKSANGFVELTSDLLNRRNEVELKQEGLSKQARINIATDTQDKIRDVENKGAADIIKVNQDLTKGLEETYNRQIKGAQDADKATIESIKSASAQRVQEVIDAAEKQSNALQEQRSSGVLSERDYQTKLRDLQHASAVAQIDEQLATLQFIIDAKKAAGQATAADEEALNKLLRQRNSENFKFQADQQKTELQQRKEFFQKVIEFANEAAKAVQAAIDGAYQSRIDTLSKESDAIAENGDREKAAVDRSLLSSEEKARKEAVIDARTKARQEAITVQQNRLKAQQAEIDRAFSIASIIENTAVAITKTLAEGGIFATPLVAVIAAIGAAQIATILATPLPKYKDGVRNKSQGSWSIFGEAGTEYVKEPGKQGYLTEGPTVGWLPAGTDVISNRELMAAMANPGKTNYVSNQLDLSALLQEQQTTRRELTKALEVKQDANYKRGYRNGKQFSEYINRNVR